MRAMQVYLVGGAVRDRLLGREVSERDWVVVGATPAELERAGFIPVGRDFPGVPASEDQGRTRAGAPRAQGRRPVIAASPPSFRRT